MLRTLGGLALLLCLGGLVAAQDKEKGKDKPKEKPKVKAELVKLDVEKLKLSVKIAGKAQDIAVTKETPVFGPLGGKATIDDPRFKNPGIVLGLVMDGKALKEIHLPTVFKDKKDKTKDKAVKDKKEK